jgi:hypothetical protein
MQPQETSSVLEINWQMSNHHSNIYFDIMVTPQVMEYHRSYLLLVLNCQWALGKDACTPWQHDQIEIFVYIEPWDVFNYYQPWLFHHWHQTHMNNCRIIISIVRVSQHFSKMLVLSRVFNTRILDTMNYTNQDYVHVNYTLIVIYSMLLVTNSKSKNISCFCLDMAQ